MVIGLTQVSHFFRLGCQESKVKSPKKPEFLNASRLKSGNPPTALAPLDP
ncbi:hypothetical protein NIES2107_27710 [Nostoc carneum NIES-2107]|nr:hypothetical protein NIES2107_27710 [Nostoc carneum NIES-2107]